MVTRSNPRWNPSQPIYLVVKRRWISYWSLEALIFCRQPRTVELSRCLMSMPKTSVSGCTARKLTILIVIIISSITAIRKQATFDLEIDSLSRQLQISLSSPPSIVDINLALPRYTDNFHPLRISSMVQRRILKNCANSIVFSCVLAIYPS